MSTLSELLPHFDVPNELLGVDIENLAVHEDFQQVDRVLWMLSILAVKLAYDQQGRIVIGSPDDDRRPLAIARECTSFSEKIINGYGILTLRRGKQSTEISETGENSHFYGLLRDILRGGFARFGVIPTGSNAYYSSHEGVIIKTELSDGHPAYRVYVFEHTSQGVSINIYIRRTQNEANAKAHRARLLEKQAAKMRRREKREAKRKSTNTMGLSESSGRSVANLHQG